MHRERGALISRARSYSDDYPAATFSWARLNISASPRDFDGNISIESVMPAGINRADKWEKSMDDSFLFPFEKDRDWLLRHCKLPVHVGIAKISQHGDPNDPFTQMLHRWGRSTSSPEPDDQPEECAASFFVPATGNCRILLTLRDDHRLSRNFGKGLAISGRGDDGNFKLDCPDYYLKAVSRSDERPSWAIAAPVNAPATISYGDPRPIAFVTAIVNNFDFEYGNVRNPDGSPSGRILRVEAAGRTVDFEWRTGRNELRRLVDSGLLGTTSFATFSFAAWAGASEDELTEFVHQVSTLLFYVTGQHTVSPIVSFYDQNRKIVRRILGEAIQSKVRNNYALRSLQTNDGLPQLFRECFTEHSNMLKSPLWKQMPAVIASIEDPTYLEQKYATLMSGVELLIRNAIIESGKFTAADAESKTLPDLIGIARGTLRWDVPKHYTEAERYRITRNAVSHGGPLPHASAQVRADFDKWKLFLIRRLFMRLGFTGHVESPQRGWASSSPVGEFSEDHNSFET